ncbi:hypothetical protein [Micromonospora sp. RV43]|uniref:hypothetical protein n=1 Tax=Micromonospora TaxID=1873 RepID=UPI00064BE2A6|nr:hypothetical protein [Micromonospora sp. RV43]
MSSERVRQAVRDWCSVLLGLGIISHQAFIVPPGKASEMLVLAGITLLTGPALGGALGLRREANAGGSGSPPQPSPSPSPSSSSPASSGAGEA